MPLIAATALWLPPAVATAAPLPLRTLRAAAPTAPDKAEQGVVGLVLGDVAGQVSIRRVVPGSPAEAAGLKVGDRIVAAAGTPAPRGVRSSTVAARIRGPVGAAVALEIARPGRPGTSRHVITRAKRDRLFPAAAEKPIEVRPGLAVLVASPEGTIGFRFDPPFRQQPLASPVVQPRAGEAAGPAARAGGGGTGAAKSPGSAQPPAASAQPAKADTAGGDDRALLLPYRWRLAPSGGRLDAADALAGDGVVALTGKRALVHAGRVRLELRPWPARDAWVIAASSAPISVTDEVAWLDLEPDGLPRVVPRKPPKVTHKHWRGTGCTLSARLAVDGKPLAGHRATLWLLDDRGAGQSTLTARADKAGVVRWSLPRQHFRAAGLRASGGGAGRDVYYAARWRGAAVDVGCEAGGDVSIDLTLAKRDKASKHTRASAPSPWVGRALPTLDVRRWHGLDEPLPADLHGKVMILYLWATWCGPCRSTSPRVSELHARLADEGVIVVKGSVDKSGTALEDHLRDRLPGAAPVAWLGPDALGALEVRGIPTTFLIDGDGVVRRVHRGSGLDIEAWQDDARALLAGKPLAVRPPAGKSAAKHPPATTAPATKRSKRP